MKTGEQRVQKFVSKLQPEIIGRRFEVEKNLIVSQQTVKQTVQADIMGSIGKILDRYGVTAQMRFLYQSLGGRLWRLVKNVGLNIAQRKAYFVWYEYANEGGVSDIMNEIFTLFRLAPPYIRTETTSKSVINTQLEVE